MYEERTYRAKHTATGQVVFRVVVKETDLWVSADKELAKETTELVYELREAIAIQKKVTPDFLESLTPIEVDAVHPLCKVMAEAAKCAGVGPMAAVAGSFAQYIGTKLLEKERTKEICIENGGDIFIHSLKDRTIQVYAGDSPFSNKIGLHIKKEQFPLGICTSAGTVGHSLSFGRADAAVILSSNTALADAVATEAGNRIKSAEDIGDTIEYIKNIHGILGCLIIVGDRLGAWGDIELIQLD